MFFVEVIPEHKIMFSKSRLELTQKSPMNQHGQTFKLDCDNAATYTPPIPQPRLQRQKSTNGFSSYDIRMVNALFGFFPPLLLLILFDIDNNNGSIVVASSNLCSASINYKYFSPTNPDLLTLIVTTI